MPRKCGGSPSKENGVDRLQRRGDFVCSGVIMDREEGNYTYCASASKADGPKSNRDIYKVKTQIAKYEKEHPDRSYSEFTLTTLDNMIKKNNMLEPLLMGF
ncbi:hypothetical protein LIER_12813 [Lithospermum erythrorhizon]|uniref:Uncharacterized protein n=1 Tax=Lithospermum erythrorhizon TaxID=34254 RepID=A0AAV3PV81_LITER